MKFTYTKKVYHKKKNLNGKRSGRKEPSKPKLEERKERPYSKFVERESVRSRVCVEVVAFITGSDVFGNTEPSKGTMVLQVLDIVSSSSEPFYGDCPSQTYTNLDVNASTHTTCTVVPQGTRLLTNIV